MTDAYSVRAMTHRGHVRAVNQDRVAVNSWSSSDTMDAPTRFSFPAAARLVCLIADGMGGHLGGDIASKLATELLSGTLAHANDEGEVAKAIQAANFQIYCAMTPQTAGMGTTVAGVRCYAQKIICFNVGDSRVYAFSGGRLDLLTEDDRPNLLPRRGMITQALGGTLRHRQISPHVRVLGLLPDCKYLICSDGLTGKLTDSEIMERLASAASEDVTLLLTTALERGAEDNVSAIVIETAADEISV